MKSKASEYVFNDGGEDLNFRIESDTNDKAFFLDGLSGNVGIGTSSPDRPVHLSGSGTRNYIKAETTAATNGEAGLDIKTNTASWLVHSKSGAKDLVFFDAASAAERMRIDSAGRVIMPYQPAFQAVMTTNTLMLGGLTTIPFDSVKVDVSNGLSNGNFTAPVSGNYFISATLSFDGGKDSSDDTGFYGIYKNNAVYISQVFNPIKYSVTGVENTVSIAGVVPLSAGDTVQIRQYEITQTPSPKFLANYCNFSGYLIG